MQLVKVKCFNRIDQDQMHYIQRIVNKLEGLAPSDSSVLLEVFEKDGKLCGSIRINAMMMRLKIRISKQVCCYKLLDIIDEKCLSQIKKWNSSRKFMQYDYESDNV